MLVVSCSLDSMVPLSCYHEHLLRLLGRQLNTTLLLLGRVSACQAAEEGPHTAAQPRRATGPTPLLTDISSSTNPANALSSATVLLSVPEAHFRALYRDLLVADSNVWTEALIFYDSPNSFYRFRTAVENTNMILHIRSWTNDRKTNAEVLRSFKHIRTFIVDMKISDNVKTFFLLASGLRILNSMTSNVIIFDQESIMELIKDFPFMVANITVIRPNLVNKSDKGVVRMAVEYGSSKGEQFYKKIFRLFMKEVKNTLQKFNSSTITQMRKQKFLTPSIWLPGLNKSSTNQLKLHSTASQEFFFNFNFETVSLGENSVSKISFWTLNEGFEPILNNSITMTDRLMDQIHNKTFRVTTMEDPPFVMYREADENGVYLKGNNRYFGLAIDLLNALSKMKNFKYIIHTVNDQTFGSRNETTGEWNGMIGELINNADMAVASFTITYDRERVIDFTTPWMSLGLSIIIKKSKSGTKLLQFMAPLSTNVWLMMLGAYIVVSLTLFIVGRLTPYEWYIKYPCHNKTENQFSFLNSFWFTVGSLMQQGCDISPKATSTRMISTVWWFFILIMISSYTANLAAFLTIERLQSDITSVEELSRQTKVKYGTLIGGSTYSFFKNSNISTYKRMWNFMNNDRSVFVDSTKDGIERALEGNYAFILESSLNEYYTQRKCSLMPLGGLLDSRGYAIGLASGNNVLRDILSEGILRLQKDQLLEKFRREWLMKFNLTKSCFEHNSHSSTVRNQLGLEKMGGAFFGLLFGLVASCMVSCMEVIIWAVRRTYRRNIATAPTAVRANNIEGFCGAVQKQIRLAACHCHRYKPTSLPYSDDEGDCPNGSHNHLGNSSSCDLSLPDDNDSDSLPPFLLPGNSRSHSHHHHHIRRRHANQQPQQRQHRHRNSRKKILSESVGSTTFQAGSATVTVPMLSSTKLQHCSSAANRIAALGSPLTGSPLTGQLPLETRLLIKYNSTDNLVRHYSCYVNNTVVQTPANGDILLGHKITSL